jgi:hypothetical protein
VSTLQGRRLTEWDFDYALIQPGDYWRPPNRPDGEWWFKDPFGRLGRVSTHKVEVHEDGTITVTPSIAPRPDDPPGSFHGFLTKGVWTW